jgi:hypothetical protein
VSVTVDIKVDDGVLKGILVDLQSKTSPTGVAAFLETKSFPLLRNRMAMRFAFQGDDVSGPWEELAESTGLIRESKGFPPFRPINVRTADMRTTLLNSHIVKRDTLSMPGPVSGTVAKKIAVAQRGLDHPETPAREVLGLTAVDYQQQTKALMEWIMGP